MCKIIFAAYNETSLGGNMINCDSSKLPGKGQVCIVDLDQFGPCGPENGYGYNTSQPCVFLKLNRVSNKNLHILHICLTKKNEKKRKAK